MNIWNEAVAFARTNIGHSRGDAYTNIVIRQMKNISEGGP